MGRFLRPGYKSAMLEQYGGFVKLRASRNGGGLQRFCRRRMRRSCRAARRTPKSPPRTPAAAGPLRGSRPVATSTYPFLPNISRGEREEEKKSGISTRKAPRRAGRWGQLLGLRRRHCLRVCSSGSGARHRRLGVTAALSGSSMPRGCAGGPAWPCRSRR